jgi:hypothetical protein
VYGCAVVTSRPVAVVQGAADMSATTSTVTLINAFEVPPEADEPFIAGWSRCSAVVDVGVAEAGEVVEVVAVVEPTGLGVVEFDRLSGEDVDPSAAVELVERE